MQVNVVEVKGKLLCSKCENPVNETHNFCPICGNPLTKEAVVLNRERNLLVKVETAKEIAKFTKDPKVLAYAEKMKK